MYIWIMHLKPYDKKPYDKTRRPKNQFGFCYQRNIVGVSLKIDLIPCNGRVEYKVAEHFTEARNIENMRENDLVWTENPDSCDRLYLGELVGRWENCEYDVEHKKAGVISAHECKLYEVRAANLRAAGFTDNEAETFFTNMQKKLNNRNPIVRIKEINIKNDTRRIWNAIQNDIEF